MKHIKPILITLVGFIIFGLLFFVIIGVAIYKFNSESRFVKGASFLIPYPAVRIGKHFIRYSEFVFDFDTLKYFYEGQKDKSGMPIPNEQKLKKNVINRLINNYFLEKLAKEKNIIVSKEDIEKMYQKISQENQGEENLKKLLKTFYNWTPKIFKERIIYFGLLNDKLAEAYGGQDKLDEEIKKEMDNITIVNYLE